MQDITFYFCYCFCNLKIYWTILQLYRLYSFSLFIPPYQFHALYIHLSLSPLFPSLFPLPPPPPSISPFLSIPFCHLSPSLFAPLLPLYFPFPPHPLYLPFYQSPSAIFPPPYIPSRGMEIYPLLSFSPSLSVSPSAIDISLFQMQHSFD